MQTLGHSCFSEILSFIENVEEAFMYLVIHYVVLGDIFRAVASAAVAKERKDVWVLLPPPCFQSFYS